MTDVQAGVTPDEIARAKDEIAIQFPRTFQATGRISTRLKALESLIVYGLPDDYYSTYLSAVRAVGRGDVQRASKEYLQPDHLAIDVVGDRKTVEPSLRSLNVGAIEEVGVDDLFAPVR